MTGIERLRDWAEDMRLDFGEIGDRCAKKMDDIADQIEQEARAPFSRVRVLAVISDMESRVSDEGGSFGALVARWARELRGAVCSGERDPAEDVSVSAYDLLPQEDREALRWVREHGGLDHIKDEWCSRVPFDVHEKRRQRLLGHIAECETTLGRRNVRIEELGHRVSDLTRENAELRKRAMPEGVEWMLWDDGKPVTYDDAPDDVIGVYLALDGSGYVLMTDLPDQLMSEPSERVKRPAVLAADGEPLEQGQTVWHVTTGHEYIVRNCTNGGAHLSRDGRPAGYCRAEYLTHQRPVLDADGVPIKVGDTVWCVATDEDLIDMSIIRACWSKMREKLTVKSFITDAHGDKWAGFEETSPYAKTCYLTHAKPEQDSWERIEEDAGCTATKYNERRGTIFTTKQQVARDLVRRCKALAERDR